MTRDLRIRRAARITGLSIGYISRVMNGKRNPRLKSMSAIADAMGISLDSMRRQIDLNRRKGVDKDTSAKIAEGVRRSRLVEAEA